MSEVKLRLLRSVGTNEPVPLPELMQRVSLGDEQAYSMLYDELSSLVYGIVWRVLRDPAMAEEVTQEVFVEIWKQATRFDQSRGSVRGWVSTIAHRKAVDRVRSEQSRRDREDRDHVRTFERPTDEVAEEYELATDRADVIEALDALTPVQREAVTLAYFGGNTYREVASLLDVAEGTVKTRIRDGLIKLRDTLGSIQ